MDHECWEPDQSRLAIHARQGGLCALCWNPVRIEDMEAHHRLKRALMPKAALWCPCDLVGLHRRCHTQGPYAVHDHPEKARERSLVLWTNEDPREVPIQIEWPWHGPGVLLCNGDVGSTLGD
jgi:5-methylcytosine-specific restriction endonuclease McrA